MDPVHAFERQVPDVLGWGKHAIKLWEGGLLPMAEGQSAHLILTHCPSGASPLPHLVNGVLESGARQCQYHLQRDGASSLGPPKGKG